VSVGSVAVVIFMVMGDDFVGGQGLEMRFAAVIYGCEVWRVSGAFEFTEFRNKD